MIIKKQAREIELLRIAGRIVALAHQEVQKAIKPGITTLELAKVCENVISSYGATPSFKGYDGFPGSVCASVNEVALHGIPNEATILHDGDIITIDIGACYKGYHGDSAWSYFVGKPSLEDERLMKVTLEALYKGLAQIKPGNRLGDISGTIGDYVKDNGFSVVLGYGGHGIGKNLHEEPFIPNTGTLHTGPILESGMVLAIEPIVKAGNKFTKVSSNGWNVVSFDQKHCAHFEHTVLVTDYGYEILTKL